jgi:hypothetical protein
MDTPLYIRVRGRVLGPYDEEKLQSLARRGELSRMHEVSPDGTNWVRAATYPALFAAPRTRLVAKEMAVEPPPAPAVAEDELPIVEPDLPVARDRCAAVVPIGRSWYYDRDGQESGPVDEATLRQLAASGQVRPGTMVWTEGMPAWTTAGQVPGLLRADGDFASDGARSSGDTLPQGLCRAAMASRPWVIFLAVVAFVYAGLLVLAGMWGVVAGADKGYPPVMAMGLFWLIDGAVVGVGGILLINYAGRLGSLQHGRYARVLESALDKLKAFWMYVSIVLIVILAFIVFLVIWVIAIASTPTGHLNF